MMSVRSRLRQYEEVLKLAQQIKEEFPAIKWGYGGKHFGFEITVKNAERKLGIKPTGRRRPTTPAKKPGPKR